MDSDVQVLGYSIDEQGQLSRRVRYADGTEGVQTARITVDTEITREDGTVQAGAEITDIKVRSLP